MTENQQLFIKILENNDWNCPQLNIGFDIKFPCLLSGEMRVSVCSYTHEVSLYKDNALLLKEERGKSSFFKRFFHCDFLEDSNPVLKKYQNILEEIKKLRILKTKEILNNLAIVKISPM